MEQKRRNLIVIVSLLIVMSFAAGASIAIGHKKKPPRDSIGVFDVEVDKRRRAFVAIATVGEIMSPPPATISPDMIGIWRWHAQNVLRFEPAGGFGIGTTYTITLNTKRFIEADERFRGSDTVTFHVDALMVEKVVTNEEPIADQKRVIVKGEITFNYSVEPAMLITHTTLIDGDAHEPIEILDSGDDDHIISFRTQPISKSDNERTVKLVIESGLAERSHGAKLENTYTHDIKIGSSNHLSVRSIEGTSGEKESTLRRQAAS